MIALIILCRPKFVRHQSFLQPSMHPMMHCGTRPKTYIHIYVSVYIASHNIVCIHTPYAVYPRHIISIYLVCRTHAFGNWHYVSFSQKSSASVVRTYMTWLYFTADGTTPFHVLISGCFEINNLASVRGEYRTV